MEYKCKSKRERLDRDAEKQDIYKKFMEKTVLIPEEIFKHIEKLYNFKIVDNKYYRCPKADNHVVALKNKSLLDNKTLYSISVSWCDLEYKRTKLKILEKFMETLPIFTKTLRSTRLLDDLFLREFICSSKFIPNDVDEMEEL